MNSREVWIVDAVRTPIGRHGGALSMVRPDDLAARAVEALVRRTGVTPERVDDVYFGAANQSGEDNRNVARMASLLAGLGTGIPGVTVNRLCGSGLQAINSAAQAIAWGEGDAMVAGGVESMTRAPYVTTKAERAFGRAQQTVRHDAGMADGQSEDARGMDGYAGRTAENVARAYGVSRADQDAFAYDSQMKCKAAVARGAFADELVPVGDCARRRACRARTSRSRRWPRSSLRSWPAVP